MCDGIKNMKLLREQYNKSINKDIDIIEIEFVSGRLKYRDRWSVKDILDRYEIAELDKSRESLYKPMKG